LKRFKISKNKHILLIVLIFLQNALISYEERPVTAITKQRVDESLLLLCGKDRGTPVWHYILLPISKRAPLAAQTSGTLINITAYGRFVEYCDKQGKTKQASGRETSTPPKMIQTWIWNQYG
jgi:hypothetical protein